MCITCKRGRERERAQERRVVLQVLIVALYVVQLGMEDLLIWFVCMLYRHACCAVRTRIPFVRPSTRTSPPCREQRTNHTHAAFVTLTLRVCMTCSHCVMLFTFALSDYYINNYCTYGGIDNTQQQHQHWDGEGKRLCHVWKLVHGSLQTCSYKPERLCECVTLRYLAKYARLLESIARNIYVCIFVHVWHT